MTPRVRSSGFTILEVLIVVAMTGVLAAIGVPQFLRAQKRAKHAEAVTNLKSLHASMSTQAVMPMSIHVGDFDPPRGNRYSYHLADPCWTFEDRSGVDAVSNLDDVCIGVDTFSYPTFPGVFIPVQMAGVAWDMEGLMNGMTTSPGIYGSEMSWDYLAYAAGDLDRNPFDSADTWGIASADGEMALVCPSLSSTVIVPAGEPFHVYDDTRCD